MLVSNCCHYLRFGISKGASIATSVTALSQSSSTQFRHTASTRKMSTDIRNSSTSDGSTEFQKESDFPLEVQHALQAIRKACHVTRNVQLQIPTKYPLDDKGDGITQTKRDASPVTIADYATQAIVLQELKRYFPEDIFLAEESSDDLRDAQTSGDVMVSQIQELTGIESRSGLFNAIDIGQSYRLYQKGQSEFNLPPSRLWCLDPIDGTKGFLRKGQYCVALALLECGVPTIGVLACPNLNNNEDGVVGCIFVALKGKGCYQIGMDESSSSSYFHRLGYRNDVAIFEDARKARFCVAVEQGFNDPEGTTLAMGAILHGGLNDNGEIRHCSRMDSQVKYGVIARGDAEFYVRLPKSHKDNIWDVAAGALCLEEVGGKVTDTIGMPLDFTYGAKLPTVGILGARTEALHDVLLQAYDTVTSTKR
jgi:3'(2'), 5'-bisphosphate nucleotidase